MLEQYLPPEEYTDEQINRFYGYSDNSIQVTAQVLDPAAVPDNAELVVTPIVYGDAYDAYMSALNDQVEGHYDESNTLLYDIAFLAPKADENGNILEGEFVEIKPSCDSVSITMQFIGNQLTENLNAGSKEEIQIVLKRRLEWFIIREYKKKRGISDGYIRKN